MPISIDLCETLVTEDLYKDKSSFLDSNSFLFYGFKIKNKYDENRLKICSNLNPIRFKHTINSPTGEKDISYYYGVKLKGNKLFDKLCKSLVPASVNIDNFLTLDNYRRFFSEYNIETSQNYLYYSIGIYPFNDINDLHNGILDPHLFYLDESIPWYQRMASVKPFIICRTR